jgi:hypothetical protein
MVAGGYVLSEDMMLILRLLRDSNMNWKVAFLGCNLEFCQRLRIVDLRQPNKEV